MPEETKVTVGVTELVEFGKYLNDLHDTDRTFEMEDANRHMKACSLNDVIASFQTFSDRKTDSFKVRIVFTELLYKTIEFKRVTGK
jgi:hypothetical protein